MKLAVALTVTVLIAAGAVASAKALIELGAANLRTGLNRRTRRRCATEIDCAAFRRNVRR